MSAGSGIVTWDRPIRWRALACGVLGAALLLAGVRPVLALDPGKAITQYVHNVWQAEQGLPQNSVQTILQTRDGYLWLGTVEGLVRFDGVRFTVFDTRNTPELGNNFVLCLLEDRAGRLWIGTSGGLVRLEDGRFTGYGAREGLPSTQVRALVEDRHGRLWAGTLGGGLARLEGGRFVREPSRDALGARVRALFEDHEGALWVGTEAGLARLKHGTLTSFTTKEGLSSDSVYSLHEDREGNLWIGTQGGGLNRLSDGRLTAFTTKAGLSNDNVWSVYEDREGNLWIGTGGGGLSRLREGRFTSFTSANGLSNDNVWSVYEDREGNLWIGTGGGGLNRLRDSRFTVFTTKEGLSNDNVWSVYEDREGSLWVGTDGGLNRLRDSRFTAFTTKEGLSNNTVWSVYEDREGSLWIGTYGGGLNRLRAGRLTAFTTKEGLSNDTVTSLQEDREGSLWIGTYGGGLNRLRAGRLTAFTTKEGLSNNGILALQRDPEGSLWIGTQGGGLNRLKDGRFTAFTTKEGLSSDILYSLHEDQEGSLWIGTQGGGLNRLKDGRFKSITTREGLFDDTVLRILEDDRGYFWMSCNKGIFRVARQELTEVAEGRRQRVTSVAYGTADGMKSAECNGGQPAGWRTRDGRLWFPTIRGVVVVDPAHLPTNKLPPPVAVEELLADERVANRSGPLRLPAGTRALEIHYTALSLRNPAKVRFRYRLEGFDEGWVEAGTRRTAYYTKVPHGEYRFRVIACNDDGLWNEEGAALAFAVEPRYYETRWFRLLAAVLMLAALAGAYRVRMGQLRARERELVEVVEERTQSLREEKIRTEAALAEAERARRGAEEHERQAEEANRAKSVFLANMSHELRTPLNGILGFAQLMDRSHDRSTEDRHHLGTILKSGEHLLGLINDVLSLSKIEAGRVSLTEAPFDLPSLLRGIEDMLRIRAEAKDLWLKTDLYQELPRVVVGDEGKLRQVLVNLLGNAVKFTESGGVTLRAQWAQDRAVFEVEDTGPGIAPEELGQLFEPFVQIGTARKSKEGTGLGLALSRQLTRRMGGDITVESALGRRTTFRVEVSLPATTDEAAVAMRSDRRRVRSLAPGQPACRVLVVDDLRDNRVLLSGLLASVGFDVKEAASGEEAIALWREWQPQLIWMDKRMPGIDGLETTRRIREEERRHVGRRVPIIALSASALEHERDEILASGCDDFVPKPFREGTIFAKMAERLGVSFVYDEPAEASAPSSGDVVAAPPVLTAERLARMPTAWLSDMRRAVTTGNTKKANGLTDELAPSDARLAEELRAMIRRYDLDTLDSLLSAAAAATPQVDDRLKPGSV